MYGTSNKQSNDGAGVNNDASKGVTGGESNNNKVTNKDEQLAEYRKKQQERYHTCKGLNNQTYVFSK